MNQAAVRSNREHAHAVVRGAGDKRIGGASDFGGGHRGSSSQQEIAVAVVDIVDIVQDAAGRNLEHANAVVVESSREQEGLGAHHRGRQSAHAR